LDDAPNEIGGEAQESVVEALSKKIIMEM